MRSFIRTRQVLMSDIAADTHTNTQIHKHTPNPFAARLKMNKIKA